MCQKNGTKQHRVEQGQRILKQREDHLPWTAVIPVAPGSCMKFRSIFDQKDRKNPREISIAHRGKKWIHVRIQSTIIWFELVMIECIFILYLYFLGKIWALFIILFLATNGLGVTSSSSIPGQIVQGSETTLTFSATNSDAAEACDVPYFNLFVDATVSVSKFTIFGGSLPDTPILIKAGDCDFHPFIIDQTICAPVSQDLWVVRPIISSLIPTSSQQLMSISVELGIPNDWPVLVQLTLLLQAGCVNPEFFTNDTIITNIIVPPPVNPFNVWFKNLLIFRHLLLLLPKF